MYPEEIKYMTEDFRRADESLDSKFYAQPRMVQHIDEGCVPYSKFDTRVILIRTSARTSLQEYYGSVIQRSDSILDLCTSWTSHLPSNLYPKHNLGIGMNLNEMEKNKHLTGHVVHDLNTNPAIKHVDSKSMDVVICNVSVDYLVKPVEVFREMHRVLRDGGTAHMAFSNRCFPDKVIGKWLNMNEQEQRHWVGGYFYASGGWTDVEEVILREASTAFFGMTNRDPLYVVRAKKVEEKMHDPRKPEL